VGGLFPWVDDLVLDRDVSLPADTALTPWKLVRLIMWVLVKHLFDIRKFVLDILTVGVVAFLLRFFSLRE
jgi:hypothetical protein